MSADPQPPPVLVDVTNTFPTRELELNVKAGKWRACTRVGLQRLPIPFWVLVCVVVLLCAVEQLVEYSLRGAGWEGIGSGMLFKLLAVPVMFIYLLVTLRVLKNGSIELLIKVRRVVQISDEEFDEYVRRMVCMPWGVELLLLAVSALFVCLLLIVLRSPTPVGGGVARLPYDPVQATLIIVTYTLLGWYLLLLLYTSIRLGRQLSLLTCEPISINVFDPLDRLPFGQLSLLHSLTLAGLILVLVIPLGRPTELIDYLVLTLLSIGSLLVLILPLRGIRRQVARAKDQVLDKLYFEFDQLQDALMTSRDPDAETLKMLADRAQVLGDLRSEVLRAPTWPFRNASATIRAGLAALSPVLYFTITEMLRTLLIPLLRG